MSKLAEIVAVEDEAYRAQLEKAASLRDKRIAQREAGNDRWQVRDGIDPIAIRYRAAIAAAERAKRFALTGRRVARKRALAAYRAGAEACARGEPLPANKSPAWRKGWEEERERQRH